MLMILLVVLGPARISTIPKATPASATIQVQYLPATANMNLEVLIYSLSTSSPSSLTLNIGIPPRQRVKFFIRVSSPAGLIANL